MLDRTVPPPYQAVRSFSLLPLRTRTLINGARIHAVEGGGQDVLKLEFIFPAGRWFEGKVGLSYFTGNLLNKGTPERNSFQLASELEFYGVEVQVQPGFDFVSISFHLLRDKLERLVEIIFSILQRPTFPEAELRQAKELYLENLRVNNEKPGYIASKRFREKLFGASPYGTEIEEKDIAALSRTDLDAFFHRYFIVPDIIASGKVGDEVLDVLDKSASRMGGGTPVQHFPKMTLPPPTRVHEPRENSVQSSIRLGRLVPGRQSADYFRLLFLNHILGGYFGSRLMKSIREEKGLTYGIHSSLHRFVHSGFIVIGTDVNKQSREEAIEAIWKEMEQLLVEPVPHEEFETARNHFIGSFLTELSSAFEHAEKHKSILLYELPKDYYQQMIRTVGLLKPEHILETAATYFKREAFVEVSVG